LVVRALRRQGVVHRHQLLRLVIVYNFFADIHSLVVCFDTVIVAECRMNLLLDYAAHTIGQVVSHGIQKGELGRLLLYRQSSHCDELLEEPLVGLA